MKQKELPKMFMMMLNWKKNFGGLYEKYFGDVGAKPF